MRNIPHISEKIGMLKAESRFYPWFYINISIDSQIALSCIYIVGACIVLYTLIFSIINIKELTKWTYQYPLNCWTLLHWNSWLYRCCWWPQKWLEDDTYRRNMVQSPRIVEINRNLINEISMKFNNSEVGLNKLLA